MLVCKEGQVSGMEAKKFWSQGVTVENSSTLDPTLQAFVSQSKLLEQCVKIADYKEKGYFDPHSTALKSESLINWAIECTSGRAPQVWSNICNMLLSRGEQATRLASIRGLTEQVGTAMLRHYASTTVKTYRDIKESMVGQLRNTKKVAPAPVFTKNSNNETVQVCAWNKCRAELWNQTDDGIT